MEINTREIASHLMSYAKLLEAKAKELDGYDIEDTNSPSLYRKASDVKDLANSLYEAKATIEI